MAMNDCHTYSLSFLGLGFFRTLRFCLTNHTSIRLSKNAAVLAVYAEVDSRVNASRDAMGAALTKAGAIHEIKTFPGVDHAFFNDTGARYNAVQATAAWNAVLAWLARYIG